jgi:hypothetical protein
VRAVYISVVRLIGRDRELAALRVLLDRAAAGAGGVLVMYGPPGAGRTALADAAAGEGDGGHTSAGVPGTPVVTEARRHPLTGASYSFGGTRAGNAHARADSWPRVVAFLREALG